MPSFHIGETWTEAGLLFALCDRNCFHLEPPSIRFLVPWRQNLSPRATDYDSSSHLDPTVWRLTMDVWTRLRVQRGDQREGQQACEGEAERVFHGFVKISSVIVARPGH